jgi:hypothetical protein
VFGPPENLRNLRNLRPEHFADDRPADFSGTRGRDPTPPLAAIEAP